MLSRSRSTRYIVAIGVLALLAVALVAIASALTERERRDIQDDAREATRVRGLALELSIAVHEQETTLLEFVLHPGPAAAEHFEEAVALQDAVVGRVGDLSGVDLAGADRTIDDLIRHSGEWREEIARPLIAEALRGGTATPGEEIHATEVEALLGDLVAQLDEADAQLRSREDGLAGTQVLATGFGLGVMILAALLALSLIRRYGRELESDAQQAGVLNRFTEVTSFAADDASVASSNLEALALLARPDAAVTHVLNRSKDRAVPEAVRGDAIAEVLSMHALAACPGVVRGSMYVTDDASAPLSVHCPVYPKDSGTVACVPLNSGESVGAVHLYWARPNALSLSDRPAIARIAEHAALAIGNRRLLAALHGQANTDPRTGLANSRAFDIALESALQGMTPASSLSVLMLDLDHFKDFNDRHGHPAGDEALRAFAGVLRSCMREGDLAARYGGEEFAVLLVDVDPASALPIAERIRSRTETTIISLAPGLTDRITVSIGMASAPTNGTERVDVLRAADEALYRAKHAGRNRVMLLTEPAPAPVAIGGPRPASRTTRRSAGASSG